MKQHQDLNEIIRSNPSPLSRQSPLTSSPQYRVGEPYLRGHRRWPEGTQFTCARNRFELTLFQAEIGEGAVSDLRQGAAEFALIVDLPLIVFAHRFGGLSTWSDVPFSWHLQPSANRVLPSLTNSPDARDLLWLTLVGSRDGIIHAQRGMTLSPTFSFALRQAILAQATTFFDPAECTLAISRLYISYPDIADRLTLATARTLGNE